MNKPTYLYGARDVDTGKMVSDITNPGRKYWENRKSAQRAIDSYNQKAREHPKNHEYRELELVVFQLVEIR